MTDKEALQAIMQVIGPEATSECDGCRWEVNEALRIIRAQGIEYRRHNDRSRPAHDVAAERRGNEVK